MAKAGGVRDQYSNKFYGSVTESAANTLTFSEIPTNVSVFEKQAWILNKLEYFLPAAALQLAAADDKLTVALTNSENITSLSLADPAVIDLLDLSIHFSTAVGFAHVEQPVTRDFTNMPGGGIIISPRPLFLAIKGTSLGQAMACEVRGAFTMKELSADEYLELVDFYRIVK